MHRYVYMCLCVHIYTLVYILYMYIFLEGYTAIAANYQQLFWGINPVVGGNGTKR